MGNTGTQQRTRRRLITTHEAAAWLAVSEQTLRHWRCAGEGPPFVRINGAIRYDIADLERYVAQSRVEPKS